MWFFNINRNKTLVEERLKKTNNLFKLKNIIFFYFDSLGRQQLHRKLKDLSGFLSDIFDRAHTNYESFEFLKYHTFENYNLHQSINAMFYGTDSLLNNYDNNTEVPLHILSHLNAMLLFETIPSNIVVVQIPLLYFEYKAISNP